MIQFAICSGPQACTHARSFRCGLLLTVHRGGHEVEGRHTFTDGWGIFFDPKPDLPLGVRAVSVVLRLHFHRAKMSQTFRPGAPEVLIRPIRKPLISVNRKLV